MRMRKSGLALSCFALVTLILAACSGAAPAAPQASQAPAAPAAAAKPIKVAALYARTGAVGIWGEAHFGGTKLYFDELFNKAGGLNGRRVELVDADSQSSPDIALAKFQELAGNPDIVALVGPSATSESMGVRPIARQTKLPFFAMAMSAPFTQLPDAEFAFRPLATDNILVESLIRVAYEKMNVRKFGLLYATDAYGDGFRTVAKQVIAKLSGAQIVAEQSGETKGTDFSIQLIALKRADPEFVLIGLQGPGAAYVPKSSAEVGWDVPMGGTGPVNDATTVNIGGKAAEGVIFSDAFAGDQPAPGIQTQMRDLWAKTGKPWHTGVGYGFAAAMSVGEAIKLTSKNGWDINRENLKKATEQLTVDLPTGHAVYSATNHDGPQPGTNVIGRIKDGKFVLWNAQPAKTRSDIAKN